MVFIHQKESVLILDSTGIVLNVLMMLVVTMVMLVSLVVVVVDGKVSL